ncbi:threonylcarbamoyl-AMP synthase [Candidatus Peregrinibacteria bacterium]|nr:threonylcarbamoyl-AMP synthase [Candidatus Peregrinibacteria bacterium]
MIIYKIQYRKPIPEKILCKAVSVLRKGGVIAHPTDTCYGFAVDIFNAKAIARLYRLKKMLVTKPVTIMAESFSEAQRYGEFSLVSKNLAKKYWPGALTLIVPRKKTLPAFLNPNSDTIGIRVPDCPVSLALMVAFGGPLCTTSANITTLPSPYGVSDMLGQFRQERVQPDLILDAGTIPFQPPSTIVKVMEGGVKVMREGAVKIIA